MTTLEPDLSAVLAMIPPESVIADPSRDEGLDAIRFREGFDDASRYLRALPVPWARQHATTTLDSAVEQSDPSYHRGYRAALYGYLRHAFLC